MTAHPGRGWRPARRNTFGPGSGSPSGASPAPSRRLDRRHHPDRGQLGAVNRSCTSTAPQNPAGDRNAASPGGVCVGHPRRLDVQVDVTALRTGNSQGCRPCRLERCCLPGVGPTEPERNADDHAFADSTGTAAAHAAQVSRRRTDHRPSAAKAGTRSRLPITAGAAATHRHRPCRTTRRRTSSGGWRPSGSSTDLLAAAVPGQSAVRC